MRTSSFVVYNIATHLRASFTLQTVRAVVVHSGCANAGHLSDCGFKSGRVHCYFSFLFLSSKQYGGGTAILILKLKWILRCEA